MDFIRNPTAIRTPEPCFASLLRAHVCYLSNMRTSLPASSQSVRMLDRFIIQIDSSVRRIRNLWFLACMLYHSYPRCMSCTAHLGSCSCHEAVYLRMKAASLGLLACYLTSLSKGHYSGLADELQPVFHINASRKTAITSSLLIPAIFPLFRSQTQK